MAPKSFAFDTNPLTNEQDWSDFHKNFVSDGVVGGYSTPGLNVTAAGAGLAVTVAPGEAYGRGWYYADTASFNLTGFGAAGSSPRIDVVALEATPSGNQMHLVVVAGTPAATPSAPALTRSSTGIWQRPLAYVRVNPGDTTITAPRITDARMYASVQIHPCRARGDFPTADLYPGFWADERNTGKLLRWSGTGWLENGRAERTSTGTLTMSVPATGSYDSGAAAYADGVVFTAAPTVTIGVEVGTGGGILAARLLNIGTSTLVIRGETLNGLPWSGKVHYTATGV